MTTHPNLILIGFMGSGKTSIGRLAAHRLRFRFIDTDALIVERAGLEIPEIFARHGEEFFRDLETRVVESLVAQERCVIATGGGAVLREENRKLLQALGFVALLTACHDVLFERLAHQTKRPLLRTADPKATVERMLAEREPAYSAAAHWTLDTSSLTREQAADALVAAAREAFGWKRVTA